MLALIALLLAALAASVGGASIPSSDFTPFSPANDTTSALKSQGGCHSDWSKFDLCACFGDRDETYGVDRSHMIDGQ